MKERCEALGRAADRLTSWYGYDALAREADTRCRGYPPVRLDGEESPRLVALNHDREEIAG
jgi:hypothetical protein